MLAAERRAAPEAAEAPGHASASGTCGHGLWVAARRVYRADAPGDDGGDFFKPLNERVPAYQKPFTLLQEIILEGQPSAQAAFKGKDSLTLGGTLDYHACDDKLCFNPASIPLSWTVSLRPLVLQRPTVAR